MLNKWHIKVIINSAKANLITSLLKKDKVQDINIHQLKLEVHDSYKKHEKLITNFEPVNGEDVISKAYLGEKLLKINGHISLLQKEYKEIKLLSDKQSIEEVLIPRAVKTTRQILHDNVLFDKFPNAHEVLKIFFVCYKTLR